MLEQPVFQAFDPDAEVEITTRDLPHWFQPGVAIFVTFRTCDSMPQSVTDLWHREQIDWLGRHGITVTADEVHRTVAPLTAGLPSSLRGPFRKFRDRGWHNRLDEGHGECLLRRPELAAMVAESIEKFDADRYDLDSFVVMPNHVHVLLQCRGGWTLRRVATTWLEFTARRINKALGRSGHFWQSEPFDHLVRSEEQFVYLRQYIRDNPARAGLTPGKFLYWAKSGPPGSGGGHDGLGNEEHPPGARRATLGATTMNQLYIDGVWTDGRGGRTWTVTNPATGEWLADVAVAAAEDVDRAVCAARRAFDDGPWPRLDPLARGRLLYQLAERIRAQLEDFAMTDTRNVGKPIRDTRGFDVPCAADLFESYAGLPDKIAGKCYGTLPDNVTMQFREPMGAIAAIVPWNFPLTNAAIKLAPILACGNTVVLKPSEVSPLSALMLAKLAHEVGFPPGVVNVIHGTGAETGTALVRHPGIDKITFTGRHQTGIQMLEAAKVGMKGVMLELGGKTPSLVFPDAPLDQVVNGVITGIFYNLGQVCVAGSRLLVHETQHDELLERIIAKVKLLRQGDPTDPSNHLGCLASPLHCATVRRFVEQAQHEGARCVLTGSLPEGPQNCFHPPTIFDRVTPPMTIAREEVFGPVLSVLTFRDEDDAVRMANDCAFGLMANLWTSNGSRALRVARRLRAGRIAINGGGALRPNVPVFGYKLSGIGAELGFAETVHEYTNSKAVLYSLATEKTPWPE